VTEPLPELLDAKRLQAELGVSRAVAEKLMRKLEIVQFEDVRKAYVRRSDVLAFGPPLAKAVRASKGTGPGACPGDETDPGLSRRSLPAPSNGYASPASQAKPQERNSDMSDRLCLWAVRPIPVQVGATKAVCREGESDTTRNGSVSRPRRTDLALAAVLQQGYSGFSAR
jgi:hypothetical protein